MTQIRTMTDKIIINYSIIACERATKIDNYYDNIQCQITHAKIPTAIQLILIELHHKVAQKYCNLMRKIVQCTQLKRSIDDH